MSEPLFFEDRHGSESDSEELHEAPDVPVQGFVSSAPPRRERKAVWVDDDDHEATVNLSNVKRRRKLRNALGEKQVPGGEYSQRIRDFYTAKTSAGGPELTAWAQLPGDRKEKANQGSKECEEEENSDDDFEGSDGVKELLRSTAKILRGRNSAAGPDAAQDSISLQSNILNIRQVRKANHEDPNSAEARCVEFHPSGRLLLTAGLDKTLRVFQVDGKQNAKVQGVHVKNFPIHTAKFTGGGTQVVLAGRRKFFHEVDMSTGRIATVQALSSHEERSWERFEVSADGSKLAFLGQQGKIVLVSNKGKREIGQLRLNDRVANVAFAPEGENENHIYASSNDGTVYLWDTRRMGCVDRHMDEGAIHSTSLAASASHYALGSDSGVVNVYPSSSLRTSAQVSGFSMRTEKPKKTFFNLTTSITNVAFNCDGKLMAFSSHEKKNAVRIAYMPTMTVYSNWPSVRANVRRACCLKFSPKGGYLAIGNDKGEVQLMRIAAYAAG